MKKLTQRLVAALLAAVLLAGALPAYAADNGDPNPTRRVLTLHETIIFYDDRTHVAYADTHDWPSSGTVCMEVAGRFTLSDLNGFTIPANLIVDVYQRFDGDKLQFLVRYDTTNGRPVTVTDAEADAANAGRVAGFSDVNVDDYYADAVQWAVENGVTTGTSATAFSPDATVTRAEAVTFLWRAAGSPEPAAASSAFSDVADPGAYYYKAVLWAAEQGITNGVGGGRFDLNATLAYDQILAMLCRAAGGDASGSDWSSAAVSWAASNGLTDGLDFAAQDNCPRSDVVYCLWMQLADHGETSAESPQNVPAGLSDLDGARAAIINGFLERQTQIDVSAYNLESSAALELALEIADKDGENPYRISLLSCYQSAGEPAGSLGVYYLWDVSSSEPGSSEEVQAMAEDIAAEVVTSGMSDYEAAKALHDYLVLNCAYDMHYYSGNIPAESYTAYGALANGTAVCAGYAKAYQALLEAVGIPCEYVTGYGNGGSHAWNLVQIDGEWYHVDATWDDPVPNREGYVRYDYFLKSDAYMGRDHSNWQQKQVCTSTRYDNADLPDTEEQAEQEQQEQQTQQDAQLQETIDAFLQLCCDAIDALPFQTEAALQAATDDELNDAYRVTIELPANQLTREQLYLFYEQARTELPSRYPGIRVGSLDTSAPSLGLYRDDVREEQDRRRTLLQDEQDRQDAEDAADAVEIQARIEQTIQSMDCETFQLTLSGYTDEAVRLACSNMAASGYSFGGYTASDYRLRAESGGVVNITNYKWVETEVQRYVELLEAAIDNRELQVELAPGSYPDREGWYYASSASRRVGTEGYTTASGLVCGQDYEVIHRGSHVDTDVHTVTLRYPDQTNLSVDDYVAQIQSAIRNGETSVQLQFQSGDDSRFRIEEAYSIVNEDGYSFDGYTCGVNYTLGTRGSNSSTGIYTISIQYISE
ncbi:MAG TPA: S-layer homology domain-containing protein [Candidatus Ventrousia excrementavium]|uniref:S-layer homology domain-containing protein n=1 Tax=Candidatus Ventrousia excrementavium TaxID=2840961 RepID=A0A9D1IXN8_9CLOT|nr:S-layer homology domain-containing protein [Candidatus Ventrousia excrementavium]